MRLFALRRADALALALLAAVVLAIHWRWFLPGVITDQDWRVYSAAQLHALFPSPSVFDLTMNLGADNRDSINFYPMISLMALIARLGASPGLAVRLVVMFPTIVLLGAGGYIFARTYVTSVLASWLAGAFYACNAYVDVIIGRGQMTVAESAAWSAIALAACVRAVRPGGRARDAALAALCLGLAFVCDVRIALLACTAAIPLCAIELRRDSLAGQLARGAAIGGALALLLLYTLIPTLASHLQFSPPSDFGDAGWLSRLSFTSLAQALTFDHPLWYDNAVHTWRWKFAIFLVPVVVGFWVMLRDPEQRPRAGVMLALVAAGAVFVAGTLTWFGPVYVWLFMHTWYVHLFRDPSKFTVLMLPGYALAFGTGAAAIVAWMPRRWMQAVAVAAFIVLALWPSRPIFTGAQTQLYWPKQPAADETLLAQTLSADPIPSRVLWTPIPDRFIPPDDRHPAIDALWFAQIAVDGVSSLSDSQRLARALRSLGIGYVVVLRNESASLAYPPTYVAYRTIRTYAALGAFGVPLFDGPALSVFKVGGVMRFSADPALAGLRVNALQIPSVRDGVSAGPVLRAPVRMTARGAVSGAWLVPVPSGVRGARDPALVAARPPRDTLFASKGALRLDGLVPEREGAVVVDPYGALLDVPDWTGYVDVGIRVRRVGAARPYLLLRTQDRAFGYEIRGVSRPGDYHVMLPAEDVPRTVRVRASPPADISIESSAFVPASYHGLIDPAALARARPTRTISILIPLAAAVAADGAHDTFTTLPLQTVRQFPAMLAGSGRVSGTLAGPMSASPLWSTAPAPDARAARAPSRSLGDFAAADLPPDAAGVTFEYSVDRQLALGEILSLLVALGLIACIMFDPGARRAGE